MSEQPMERDQNGFFVFDGHPLAMADWPGLVNVIGYAGPDCTRDGGFDTAALTGGGRIELVTFPESYGAAFGVLATGWARQTRAALGPEADTWVSAVGELGRYDGRTLWAVLDNGSGNDSGQRFWTTAKAWIRDHDSQSVLRMTGSGNDGGVAQAVLDVLREGRS